MLLDVLQDWGVGTGTKYPTWVHARGVGPGTRLPGWAREYREAWDADWNMMPRNLKRPGMTSRMPRRDVVRRRGFRTGSRMRTNVSK